MIENKLPTYSLLIILILCLLPFTPNAQLSKEEQSQLDYFKEEVEKNKKEGNLNETARFLNKIAFLYWDVNESEKAIEHFIESLAINEKVGNKNAIASINSQIGMLYSDIKKYDLSLTHFEKSLAIRKEMKDKAGIVSELINAGMVLGNMNKHEEAIQQLEEALRLAKELNNIKLIRNCYGLLSEAYEKSGNTVKSLECYSYYSSFEKQIQKEELKKREEENRLQIQKLEARTLEAEEIRLQREKELAQEKEKLKAAENTLQESEKLNKFRDIQIDLLNKEKALKELTLREREEQLKNEKLISYMISGGAIAIGLFAFVIFRSNRQKAKANLLLERRNHEISLQRDALESQGKKLEKAFEEIKIKNHNITSSISYAQRIQHAMLPNHEPLKTHLPESFILFKPRDLVSGDFYWYHDVPSVNGSHHSSNRDFLITAVDCTGHGVPGAFMSMIGFNLLNESINKGITQPNEILYNLDKGVRTLLKQDITDNKDGMDMALCKISASKKQVEFSGAKNPLYYISNGELIEIKGDSHPIGSAPRTGEKTYTSHQIAINGPTTFYLFSDGYADQFGGESGKKFMYKNFKELLLKIHEKPMPEQKEILDETIEAWKGTTHKQIDDILVIGFRICN
ncbi:MAG TPA: tetratricopeptide repeat protein [Cytophagaceae bacterium]